MIIFCLRTGNLYVCDGYSVLTSLIYSGSCHGAHTHNCEIFALNCYDKFQFSFSQDIIYIYTCIYIVYRRKHFLLSRCEQSKGLNFDTTWYAVNKK